MVDFTILNNMTELTINNSLFNNTNEVIPELISNADTVSQGYLGLVIMIVIFIVLLVFIFRDNGDIRMDITRTLMLSSGFTFIIGIILIISDITSSFTHVMWFFVIFLISLIGTYILKKKGL